MTFDKEMIANLKTVVEAEKKATDICRLFGQGIGYHICWTNTKPTVKILSAKDILKDFKSLDKSNSL